MFFIEDLKLSQKHFWKFCVQSWWAVLSSDENNTVTLKKNKNFIADGSRAKSAFEKEWIF